MRIAVTGRHYAAETAHLLSTYLRLLGRDIEVGVLSEQEIANALVNGTALPAIETLVFSGFKTLGQPANEAEKNSFKTFAQFFAAATAAQAVINVNDSSGAHLAKRAQGEVVRYSSEYGQTADWYLAVTNHNINAVSFAMQGPEDGYLRGRLATFSTDLATAAGLALATLATVGVPIAEIAAMLKNVGSLEVDCGARLSAAQTAPLLVEHNIVGLVYLRDLLDALTDVAPGEVRIVLDAETVAARCDAKESAMIGAQAAHSGHLLYVACETAQNVREGIAASGGRAQVSYYTSVSEAKVATGANCDASTVVLYAGEITNAPLTA
ncbi:hypothetical protein [Canibacter zhoujuaniae]|uniref:hypothetical protein n=1 Tax=Canibacter zhoujuaniae TaxID=2708343 RepID=UPI00141F1EA5|nr:hypothetical protein [Canibacter zhoujuaniae]